MAAAGESVKDPPRECQPDHDVPVYCKQVVLDCVTRFDSAIVGPNLIENCDLTVVGNYPTFFRDVKKEAQKG